MTRTTAARTAGATSLVYVAAGMSSLLLPAGAPARDLVPVVNSLSALILGVTLYAITRVQDPELALLGLACRVVQAVPGEGTIFVAAGSLVFAWLLLRGRMVPTPLGGLGVAASVLLLATLLLQRGGVFTGALGWASSATWLVWLPLLVYEIALATWLMVRGVAEAQRRPSSAGAL